MWHMKSGCFLLRSENNYWEAGPWPAVASTFCATFKGARNRPKTDPRLFFFSKLFINGQAFIISGKKIWIFSLLYFCARECKGKVVKIIINQRFNFTDTWKQLWNCCNIYESAMSITSRLKTVSDPLKEIKIVKTDPKKVPSQILFLLFPLGSIAQFQFFTSQSL